MTRAAYAWPALWLAVLALAGVARGAPASTIAGAAAVLVAAFGGAASLAFAVPVPWVRRHVMGGAAVVFVILTGAFVVPPAVAAWVAWGAP